MRDIQPQLTINAGLRAKQTSGGQADCDSHHDQPGR